MKPSDMFKELTRLFGGRYQFSAPCKRDDCCPGEPDHHVYVRDFTRVGTGRSEVNSTHPVCAIVAGPHAHIERMTTLLKPVCAEHFLLK